MMTQIYETDWLASRPVYYNERTRRAGYSVHDVIDYEHLEFDPEGLRHYLDVGFSILGQTPVKHVKCLRHSSRLTITSDQLVVEHLPDPLERWLDHRCSERDVIDLLESKVQAWEQSCAGELVIPTSGGYDSRLLSALIRDKSRVRAFTYGISQNQSQSTEVVYARELSRILNTRWEQIQLGEQHRYFQYWDRLYGIATHAHGMYHIEFYSKILPRVRGGRPLLSGIIGDAWAGSVAIGEIAAPEDVHRLAYNHGVQASAAASRLPAGGEALERYVAQNRERLRDPRRRVVEAMRFKMILLSYLLLVPRALGFQPWSPFLDIDVATAMLNLPPERRRRRLWQRDFFRRRGLELESLGLNASAQNNLDLQALYTVPLAPLHREALAQVIDPAYVAWVNRQICLSRTPADHMYDACFQGLAGRAMRRLGLEDPRLRAYYAYLVLKPIEQLLLRQAYGQAQSRA